MVDHISARHGPTHGLCIADIRSQALAVQPGQRTSIRAIERAHGPALGQERAYQRTTQMSGCTCDHDGHGSIGQGVAAEAVHAHGPWVAFVMRGREPGGSLR